MREAIDAFSSGENNPSQQISTGKNARLATLLEDRLDRSLRKYARSHSEFYQGVMQASQIIDRPGSRKRSGDETPKV